MRKPNELIKEALQLKPKEKANLIEALLKSLDAPDEVLDTLWKQECESRRCTKENDWGNEKFKIQDKKWIRYYPYHPVIHVQRGI